MFPALPRDLWLLPVDTNPARSSQRRAGIGILTPTSECPGHQPGIQGMTPGWRNQGGDSRPRLFQPNLRDPLPASVDGIPAGNEPGEVPEENSRLCPSFSWIKLINQGSSLMESWNFGWEGASKPLQSHPMPWTGTIPTIPAEFFPHFHPCSSSRWE